jgi:hypothetical protein
MYRWDAAGCILGEAFSALTDRILLWQFRSFITDAQNIFLKDGTTGVKSLNEFVEKSFSCLSNIVKRHIYPKGRYLHAH